MTAVPLPIANGSYKSDSLPISAQECVNWYPNIPQSAALSEETLFGTPGLSQELTTSALSTNLNRGSVTVSGVPYFINGTTLYSVDSSNNATNEGTIAGTARCSIAHNGTKILINVPGGNGYEFDTSTSTLTQITDADFTTTNGAPQHVLWIDGYFIATTDEKKFIISALNDPTTWNGTEFGSAEVDPDAAVAPQSLNNRLLIFGTYTAEEFANTGGNDFPWQRTGTSIETGCSSPYSLTKARSSLFWMGGSENETPAIWRWGGSGEPEKVSTTAIDQVIERLTTAELAQVFAYSYSQKGAYFVCFALPETCLVFDLVTQRWHERKSFVTYPNGSNATVRYRVNSVCSAYGKLLVGDSQDGRIGSMDIDIYDEYGEEIIRTVATQPFQNNMASFFVPTVELTMESGVGNSDTTDPQVSLSRSMDGKTWTTPRQRSIGKIGEYGTRQIWTKNGRARRLEIFKFTMSGKVKPVIIQLTANIIPGAK